MSTSDKREKGGTTADKEAAAGAPNTAPNKEAQAARFGLAWLMVLIWSALVTFFTALGWLILYTPAMAIIVGGLAGSAIWRQEWLDARSQFGQPDSPQVRKFVDNINKWEDATNMAVFVLAFMINLWNYFLLLIWYVIQLIFNVAVMCIKYILQPEFQPFVTPVLVMGTQLVSTLAHELTLSSSSSASATTSTSVQTTGTGGGIIANYTQIGNFTTTELATRGFQTIMSFEPFFVAMNASQFGNMVNFLADPVLKNAPEIFKFLADTAALTSVGGAWTRVVAEDALSKQANALLTSSNCFGARALRAGLCATQMWLAESLNKVAHLDGMSIASPTCSIPEIACSIPSGAYSEQGRAPWDTDQFFESLFGTGVCGPLECEYYVEDVYTAFAAQPNATCAYWVDDPSSVYNCMVRVQNYVEVNSTSRAQASPATLAAEMCLVARAQNLQSCRMSGQPFRWDYAAQATNICNNPALNTSFAECSCRHRAPLCNGTCCDTYALHVHKQVQLQLGALTCAELGTYFPTVGAFCPLIAPQTINRTATTARFPDNTYQSLFCNYAQLVIDPLCATAPSFTHLRDLDTLSAVPSFTLASCNATIGQIGACLPVNATVDSLAFDIISFPVTEDTDAVYNGNDATTYNLGTYLITDFAVGDSAQTIVNKGLQKHFCEQVSQLYKNENMLYQSQPWMPLAIASDYCDGAVLTAAGDISISSTAFYKYQSGYGVPIPVSLAGLPNTASVFNEEVNPNLQIGGVCTGQVGPNVNELSSQDHCLEALRTLVYNLAGQATVDATEVLDVFVMQDNYTSEFYTASGLIAIDAADPNYAQKETELQRTTAALDTGLDFGVKPWEDLIAATDPFRTTFDTAPPNSSPYSNTPAYPVYTDRSGLGGAPPTESSSSSASVASGPGRVLLSVDESQPAPPVAGVDWWAKVKEFMGMRERPPDKWDRVHEALFRKRLILLGERLYTEVYLKHKSTTSPSDSPEASGGSRKLLTTGNPALDTKLAAIGRDMSNIPHRPLHLTDAQYMDFLLRDTVRLGAQTFELTTLVLLPRFLTDLAEIFSVSYGFNATELIARNAFGHRNRRSSGASSASTSGEAGATGSSLKNTVGNPFEKCGEFSDSYECCGDLVGCIDFDAITFLQEKTTAENIARWNCDDVDYFMGWQRWFWQCFVSVIASFGIKRFAPSTSYSVFPGTLVTPYNSLPTNLVNCMFVNVYFGFLGAAVVAGIYFVFTIGIIGIIAIMTSNFRQQQEDQEYTEQLTFKLAHEMNARSAPDVTRRQIMAATTPRVPV